MRDIEAELMPLCTVSEADAKLFRQWAWERRLETDFDMDVVGYLRTCMAKASRNGETLALVPVTPGLMIESLMCPIDISRSTLALSLLRVQEEIDKALVSTGMGEAYFFCKDKGFMEIAEKNGWTMCLHDPEKGVWLLKRKIPKPLGENDA